MDGYRFRQVGPKNQLGYRNHFPDARSEVAFRSEAERMRLGVAYCSGPVELAADWPGMRAPC